MNRKFILFFMALTLSSMLTAGCSKGSPEAANANSEQAKKQAEIEAKSPHLSTTVRGDIERMGLSIEMAIDALKQSKWTEVIDQLNAVNKEVTGALADTPEKKKTLPVRETLQEMKPVVERAIKTAENGGKETEGQLRELQTRVGALKALVSN
ncbi:MAG: hypothetical protein WBV94_00565 [Blastocatellia bacterium]